MAAKYGFPPNHKLALPRKLKNLLLDMAKKNPEERPSLADAIKVTGFKQFYLKFSSVWSLILVIWISK